LAKTSHIIPKFYIYLVTFWSMVLHLTTHPAPASTPQPQPHWTAGQHQARQACALQCAIASLRHGKVSTPRGRPHIGLVAAAGCVDALADAGKSAPPKASRTRGRLERWGRRKGLVVWGQTRPPAAIDDDLSGGGACIGEAAGTDTPHSFFACSPLSLRGQRRCRTRLRGGGNTPGNQTTQLSHCAWEKRGCCV